MSATIKVVTIEEMPEVLSGSWIWLPQIFQSFVVCNQTIEVIPGEQVGIGVFETAKRSDRAGYDWFIGCVARGYFGVTIPGSETDTLPINDFETIDESSLESPDDYDE